VTPGKEEFELRHHAESADNTTMIRYGKIRDLEVTLENGRFSYGQTDASSHEVDMVVLCPALVGPSMDSNCRQFSKPIWIRRSSSKNCMAG